MKMKLPANVLYHHDLRLMVWRPRAILNEKAVNIIIAFMAREEARANQPFDRFSDTSYIDAIDLNFHYIFHVSLFRRLSCTGRPPVKSAILATSSATARYGRIHALITQGSPLQVRVFGERAEAAKWLGVSTETLEY